MFDLDGRIALVTGAGSGIGLATARRLARSGAVVAVTDVVDATAVADDIGGTFFRIDVTNDAEMAETVAVLAQRYGRIDVLVNNAGITLDSADSSVVDATDDVYRRLFEVNALGVARGMRHAVPHMSAGGSIVNVSSLAGVIGFPGFPAYHLSKAGVVGLTRAASTELAPLGIRVNAVCPGFADTAMALEDTDDYAVFARHAVPLGRLATPEEVAAAIHFLASPDAGFITGQAVNVCGGLSTGPSVAVVDQAFGRPTGGAR